ncbi:MAG: hypothetical protein ACRD2A_13220 [Vicinamibacterales bacterium]
MEANVTGTRLCAFGRAALNLNTVDDNSAFGFQALDADTTGTRNNAFGANALGAIVTASDSSAFGHNALLLDTGGSNSAFGSLAADALSTATNCAAFGLNALGAVTTGGSNSAFGQAAGLALTTGTQCTFLGATADTTAATANNQCAIGFGATVGAANTMVFGNASVVTVRPMSDGACDFGLSANRWANGWFTNVRITADNGAIFTNQTDAAGVAVGTLTNAPSAGNPTFWLRIQINGANRFIPAWA